jgi:hypothetical protein
MKKTTFCLISGIIVLLLILASCEKKNHPPKIDDQTFTLEENSGVGTAVGMVLAFDEEDESLAYSILSGNTGEAFSIGTQGTITVKTREAIDFEVTPEFILKIEVKDSKQKTCVANITISLHNVEIIVADQTFSINENSPDGEEVGQISAPQAFKYTLTEGNTNNAFEVSETEGKIIVHNTAALDFEATPVFNLVIEAKDSNNEKGITHITINLNNLEIPTTGLQLYMPFNGNLNDLSPNNVTSVDYTTHNYVAGKRSEALDFNGITDYIQLTQTINSQFGLSFAFWVNTRGVNGSENNGSIISKYSKINNTRCFMVYSFGSYGTRLDNRLAAAFYKYGFSSAEHDMTKSYLEQADISVYPNPSLWTMLNPLRLVPGEWTHCVVNLTPTTIEIWINGSICTKKTREYSAYNTSTVEPVLIGNNYDIGEGTNNHFNGKLDELRVYNRGLTNEEIRTLYKE